MSLKRALAILGLGLMASTAWTSPVHAEPITIALFGSAFASTLGGTLVSTLIGTGISWLGGTVINWLFPPDKNASKSATRDPLQVQYGERVARSGIVGTVLTPGHLVHINEYNHAKVLQYVNVYADQRISDIKKARVNGKMYDLVAITTTDNAHKAYRVNGLKNTIKLRLHDGRVGQAADTNLVAQTTGWTSDKKYTGMAYIVAEVTSNADVYNGSPPEIIPVLEGGLWYDPRKDSTVGGSGSHRFNDPATWEYTANGAVAAYHYLRGVFYGSVRMLGPGIPAAKLDFDTFIAAMNACDEDVIDPNGNHRARYECHMTFDDTEVYGDVLDRFCLSFSGFWAEREGRIAIFAGKSQSSVLTFTDADLVDDEDMSFDEKRAGETLYQGIMGTYTSSLDWQPASYTAFLPSGLQLTGIEPKIMEVNFPMVKDPHQAYLSAKIKLYINNVQASASVCLDIKDAIVQVGDWVTWTSDIGAVGTRVYVVMGTRYDMKRMRMYLTLQETDGDIYEDDATVADITEAVRLPTSSTYLTAVSSPSVVPITVLGAGGETIPAIEFHYDPIDDPGIVAVQIEYRIVSTTDVIKVTDPSPGDGLFVTAMGVAPGQLYEARFKLSTIAGRDVDWTSWVQAGEVTTSFTVGAAIPPSISAQLQQLAQIRTLIKQFEELGTLLEEVDRENYNQRATLSRSITQQLGTLEASFSEIIEVALGPGGAIATALESLYAAMGGNTSEVNIKWEAVAAEAGYSARYAVTAAVNDGSFRAATFFIDVPANPVESTRIGFVAGQTVFFTSGGDAIAIIDENGFFRSANDSVVINMFTGDWALGAGT